MEYNGTNLGDVLPEAGKDETLPNSSYKTTLTLIPKPDKDIIRNKNYWPTVPMNIDTKILNKILAQITQ